MLLDVVRAAVFPITALLGPFVSDAIGNLIESDHLSCPGGMMDSCWSRKMELEADAVGLRYVSSLSPFRYTSDRCM